MGLRKKEIMELISTLGFKPLKENKNFYYKNYRKHKDHLLKVNFEKDNIEYGPKVQTGDLTTCHFLNSENFVVLECVDQASVGNVSEGEN